jgi:DNA gyrase subunit A
MSDYRTQSRGGKGTTNYRTSLYGDVANVICVNDDEDVIMIASNGVIIRIPVAEISTFTRPAKGVRVMRIPEGVKLLSVATAAHDDAEVTDLPEAPEADAGDVGDLGEIAETEENNEE